MKTGTEKQGTGKQEQRNRKTRKQEDLKAGTEKQIHWKTGTCENKVWRGGGGAGITNVRGKYQKGLKITEANTTEQFHEIQRVGNTKTKLQQGM